jgi:D-glycero-alpha-D-manno-heptose 1-phosphate guanylyltransferase
MREAIILAGGFGTRLQKVVKEVPKPMALVNGRPFLAHILDYLLGQRINRLVLSVGYKHEMIQDYFGGFYKDLPIRYVIEDTPLGTGGGIRKALLDVITDDVVIVNGDTLFQVNIDELISVHKENKSEVSIALKRFENTDRYGAVTLDADGRISGFEEKKYTGSGLINGGVYLLDRVRFLKHGLPEVFSFEKDYLEANVGNVDMFGVVSDGYFIDIGIPEDYQRAQAEVPK